MAQTKVQLLQPDLGDVIDFDASTLFVDGADNRIGIRNTNPQYELDVTGTINATNFRGNISVGTIDDWITHTGDTNTKFGFSANDTFQVQTGGAERLTIVSNGKMGLGTNNPTQYFHVVGNSASVQTEESGGGIVRMQSGGSVGYVGTYSNHPLLLQVNSQEKLRIQSDGAVMINTTNSSSRTLNLKGTFGILSSSQTGVLDMSVTDGGEASIAPYVAGGSSLIFKTNASGSGVAERLRIAADGKVGIGEDAPQQKLHLHEASSNGNFMVFTNSTTGATGNDGCLIGINSDEAGTIWNQENNYIRFGTNDTERLRIDASGGTKFTRATVGGTEANANDPGKWFKVGTWAGSTVDGAARATITVLGAATHDSNSNVSGETKIHLAFSANNILYGYFYSTTAVREGIAGVAHKYDSSAKSAEIWVKYREGYSSTACYADVTNGYFTGSNIGTNSTSTPSGATLLESYYNIWTSDGTTSSKRLSISNSGNITVSTNDVKLSGSGTLRVNSGSTSGVLNLDGGSTNHGGEINLFGGSNSSNPGIIQFRTGQGSGQQGVKMTLDSNGVLEIDQGTSGGNRFKIKNDEISLLAGVNGTGDTYAREAFFGTTRVDSGSLPILRIAGQGGIKFCVDANSERLVINSAGVLQLKQTTNTNQGIEWYAASGNKSASIGWGNGNANFEFKNFRADSQADGPYGNIDFFTGSTTSPGLKLRIQVSGEIGTNGVTNPTSALHIGGTNNFLRFGTATLGGETKAITDKDNNPYISGTPWYQTSPYSWDTGDSPNMDYFWIKIVESISSSGIGYIEYMAHGDSNYPRSVHGFLDVAKYSNGSLSISHSQQSAQAATVQCVVDSNQDVWLRFYGYDWNSDMRFRLIYGEGITMNTDFTVNGTSGGRIRNSAGTPPNMSYDIVPGNTLRWNLSNSNPPKAQYGNTESQTSGTYGANDAYANYEHRMGRAKFVGEVNIMANWLNNGLTVQSNGIDVNGAAQPVLATFKSQKNTVMELNRMYSHGTSLQFRHNNDAVGYFSVNGTSSSHTSTGSDIRFKKDVEDWSEEVLPHFKALQPKKFRFNKEDETAEKTKGYMAQDNLDKFPEAYPLNPEDDRYWFTPQHMIPYLMKALQEEIIKREEIESKYNALEARISALESS